MRDALICTPLRTPVGSYGGVFRDVPATALAEAVLRALVERSGIDAEVVDDVILGQCYPSGEAPAIGRVAALDAGFGVGVPGVQLDRRCGSGLQAVLDAAMRVQTGVAEVVVAGGAESMSQAEHYTAGVRWGARGDTMLHDRLQRARVTAGGRDHPVSGGMLETAENVRAAFAIPREEQDRLALESHRRAVAAHRHGRFADELVAVVVPQRRGAPVVVDVDEHPRPDATLEQLATLTPIRQSVDPDATVTAGNASGQNDGAAACIVASADAVEAHSLTPLLRLVTWGVGGVEPSMMGMGVVPATEAALGRAGLSLADLDVIEVNEAFAAQVLGVLRALGVDAADERVNPAGSGISLGHPVGATGARMLATLTYELHRRGGRHALETMCIGGGQGLAAVWERVA